MGDYLISVDRVFNRDHYSHQARWNHRAADPAKTLDRISAGTQYHPALGPEDWGKFTGKLKSLLPGSSSNSTDACFGGAYDNGIDDAVLNGVNSECSKPESLENKDMINAAAFLSGAAGKTGKITGDLLQYLNRILKITQTTNLSEANVDTLPALIRDCEDDQCTPYAATDDLPALANERFVNFSATEYDRAAERDGELSFIKLFNVGFWQEVEEDSFALSNWLKFRNGADPGQVDDVSGFVDAANDSLRTIEFIHNYAIPEDLGWDFQ